VAWRGSFVGTSGVTSPTKAEAMSEPERTRPSDKTRDAEEADARVDAHSDNLPTKVEEQAAERSGPPDDESARAYKEALERGARQPGEGHIP
jgi:hypothetical protein